MEAVVSGNSMLTLVHQLVQEEVQLSLALAPFLLDLLLVMIITINNHYYHNQSPDYEY